MQSDPPAHHRDDALDSVFLQSFSVLCAFQVPYPEIRDDLVHVLRHIDSKVEVISNMY